MNNKYVFILGIGIGLGIAAIVVHIRKANIIYEDNNKLYTKIDDINNQISLIDKNISSNNRISKAILISLHDNDNKLYTNNKENINNVNNAIDNTTDNDDLWEIDRDIYGTIKSIKIKKSGYSISKE